jgi:hypothetical protein
MKILSAIFRHPWQGSKMIIRTRRIRNCSENIKIQNFQFSNSNFRKKHIRLLTDLILRNDYLGSLIPTEKFLFLVDEHRKQFGVIGTIKFDRDPGNEPKN